MEFRQILDQINENRAFEDDEDDPWTNADIFPGLTFINRQLSDVNPPNRERVSTFIYIYFLILKYTS